MNGGFEELLRFKSWNIVSQNGPSQIIFHDDTFKFSGISDKGFTEVIANHWNYYSDTAQYAYGNASYSNNGKAYMGNVFKLIHVLDWEYSDDEASVSNAVGKLCRPLLKDHLYEITLHLKPFSGNHFTSSICVALTDQPLPHIVGIAKKEWKPVFELNLQPAWCLPDILEDTMHYTTFRFEYKAYGGEQFIYIGNLLYERPEYLQKQTWKKYFRSTKQYGYWKNRENRFMCIYALDEVSVIPVDSKENGCAVTSREESDTILAAQVFFNYDESIADGVDSVIDRLAQFKDLKAVIIIGHSSREGSETYNLWLSLNRAKFIGSKLSAFIKTPIEIMGRGYSDPISLTHDALNRRADIYVVTYRNN
ncbi:MAG: hypothetical protein KatS3mg031_2350 [Chitinophagales bacterium]|nr:MAG: hypothetical protein KatS3mg031_2350 [Chitinophagales bacterium]